MNDSSPNKQTQYNPAPTYLRELIAQIGLSQREIARRIGIDETLFRKYLTPADRKTHRDAPYLLQLALECWAKSAGHCR